MSSRRRLLALAALPALAGCGFRPVHRDGGPADVRVSAELAAVRVALVQERHGQLLRRSLARRLGNAGAAARYELHVGVQFGAEIQGYRRDGTPSRVRMVGTANWTLYGLGVPPQRLTGGIERAFDAYNLPENQFFAADNARDAMQARLMDQLADDVTQHLAVWFAGRGEARPAAG